MSVLVVPVKLNVPPLWVDMSIPPPASLLSLMLPASATVPPLRPVICSERPVPLPIVPG